MKSTSPGWSPLTPLSRRRFFGRAAATGGAALLASGIPAEVTGQDEGLPGLCDFPLPIPHVNIPPPGGAHFYFPGPISGAAAPTDPSGAHAEGRDLSVIFNFQGYVAAADFDLTGTGTDLTTGETSPYTFHTDMRVMDGVFVGTDRIQRKGAFVFV